MGTVEFAKVIVIGYGVVTGEVLRVVYEKSQEYGYLPEYIEHEPHPFHSARRLSEANDIAYKIIEGKAELSDYLMSEAHLKLLIISASNNYLFPKMLVENENVTIINFHNALLPKYPGRNAPSWAIYNGEDKTGITWHYVTDGIDDGDIIIQKECFIQPDIKAYELVAALMELAAEAFGECYVNILKNTVVVKQQKKIANRKIYKSTEIPGNANFSLTDSPEYIYKLLRALDYGKNGIFPLATSVLNGHIIRIRRYKIIDFEEKKEGEYRLYLPYAKEKLLMIRYEMIYDENAEGG